MLPSSGTQSQSSLYNQLYPYLLARAQALGGPDATFPVDAAACIRLVDASLADATLNDPTVAKILRRLYPLRDTKGALCTQVTESMLPLFARFLQRTVGIVSSAHERVRVPHQWLQPTPDVDAREGYDADTIYPGEGLRVSDTDEYLIEEDHTLSAVYDAEQHDSMATDITDPTDLTDEDTGAILFRRIASGFYEIDYDPEYVEKYRADLAAHPKWTATEDTIVLRLRLVGPANDAPAAVVTPTRSRSGSRQAVGTPPREASSRSSSAASVVRKWTPTTTFLAVGSTQRFRTNQRLQNAFLQLWPGAIEKTPDRTTVPHIHDPHFHQKLFTSDAFSFARWMRPAAYTEVDDASRPKAEGGTRESPATISTTNRRAHPERVTGTSGPPHSSLPFVSYKNHQAFVRTYLSPTTPYHSLLVLHSTGSGKTLTTFGVTEAFAPVVQSRGQRIHIACPRPEVCNEFWSYLRLSTSTAAAPAWEASEDGAVGQQEVPHPRDYIRRPYEVAQARVFHDRVTKDTLAAKDVYAIDTYRRIFPTTVNRMVVLLQALYAAWHWVLPTIVHVQRCTDGFVLVVPDLQTDADVDAAQTSLNALSRAVAREVGAIAGETPWSYTVTAGFTVKAISTTLKTWGTDLSPILAVVGARAKMGQQHHTSSALPRYTLVRVTGCEVVRAMEARVLKTFAGTLFVLDEAHNYTDSVVQTNTHHDHSEEAASERREDADAGDPYADADADADAEYHPTTIDASGSRIKRKATAAIDPAAFGRLNNWRLTLRVVMHILRFHGQRMRVMLLTATPMTNSANDLIDLLNLMISNDGLAHERPYTHFCFNRPQRLRAIIHSLQGRVSYFYSDEGKPVQLAPEDVFYTLPPSSPAAAYAVQSVVEGTRFPVLLVDDVDGFVGATQSAAYGVRAGVWDWRRLREGDAAVHLPFEALRIDTTRPAYSGALANAAAPPQSYVFVVLSPRLRRWSRHRFDALLDIFAAHARASHTIAVVAAAADEACAKHWANDEACASRLFRGARISVRRPLWFPAPRSAHSCYGSTTATPAIYAPALGNIRRFAETYFQYRPRDDSHYPSIVATPMRNAALDTSDPARSLAYSFSARVLQNWNVRDASHTVYHPKIDTMLSMIERLPGNAFVFLNKEGVRLNARGSQMLRFLKHVIERRFHGDPSSRLRNVHVEILHKETLAHMPPTRLGDVVLPTALHQRLAHLNTHLLAVRDDVILLGSTEVTEGLTMNEIRQVHLLEPSWNQATMNQVIGRTVRIRNHLKQARVERRNVVCCLHVTVPEEAPPPGLLGANSQRTPPLARRIGDLHRYFFVKEKLRAIERVMQLTQMCAVDYIMQDTATRHHVCELEAHASAEKESEVAPWRVWHTVRPNSQIVAHIERLRGLLDAPGADHGHGNVVPDGLAAGITRETDRAEVDWLKREVRTLFARNGPPLRTFDEIEREVREYGQTRDPRRSKRLGPVDADDDAHSTSTSLSSRAHRCLLQQFRWFATPDTTTFKAPVYALRIDPLSVLAHPEWATDPPCATLPELRRRVGEDGRMTLGVLQQTYYVPIEVAPTQAAHYGVATTRGRSVGAGRTGGRRTRRTTVPRGTREDAATSSRRGTRRSAPLRSAVARTSDSATFLLDLRVRHTRAHALAVALQELLRERLPIQRTCQGGITPRKSPFAILVYHVPYYSLQRIDLPPRPAVLTCAPPDEPSLAQRNAAWSTPPFSTPLPLRNRFTQEGIKRHLRAIVAWTEHLVAGWVTLRVPVHPATLRRCTMEHVFDRLQLRHQDELLAFFAIHGLNSSACEEAVPNWTRTHLPTFRAAIRHRWAEKGVKRSDCNPPEATDVLQALFPNHAGRVFATFSRDPATQHCHVHAYRSCSNTRGKSDVALSYAKHTAIEATTLHQLVAYFSPRPLLQPPPEYAFESSSAVAAASQPPIASRSLVVGYNRVFNHTSDNAMYLHHPQISITRKIRDASLLSNEVRAELQALEGLLPRFLPAKKTLEDVELHVDALVHAYVPSVDRTDIVIDARHCVRYVWLRLANQYIRFFYPYVIAKHPNGNRYAEYKDVALRASV